MIKPDTVPGYIIDIGGADSLISAKAGMDPAHIICDGKQDVRSFYDFGKFISCIIILILLGFVPAIRAN